MKHFFNLFTPLVLSLILTVPAYVHAGDTSGPGGTSSASTAASAAKPEKALRIFLKTGGKKTYVRGYQWMTLDLNRKISLVESARRGALRMNAVMAKPAEVYVNEVNKFFQHNPSLMQMEVGQVIQGVAVGMKDWEDGGTAN
jgi:hypothetical protein